MVYQTNHLVEHGLQSEQVSHVCFVSPPSSKIFLVELQELKNVADRLDFEYATNGTTRTSSTGNLVPQTSLVSLSMIDIPKWLGLVSGVSYLKKRDRPADKGSRCERLITLMAKASHLPWIGNVEHFPYSASKVQLKGCDVRINDIDLSVKCDWESGESGNLFFQRKETRYWKHGS